MNLILVIDPQEVRYKMRMTELFIAWVKKKLCIQSPSTTRLGYKYEYDYLRAKIENED